MKLPLPELIEKALASDSPPLVRNFGVVYSEMAFERADPVERLTEVSHWRHTYFKPATF